MNQLRQLVALGWLSQEDLFSFHIDRVRCRPLVLPVVRARPSAVAGQRYWYRWRGEAVPSSERDVRFDRWADRGPWEAVAAASPKWSESIELDISELGRLSPF